MGVAGPEALEDDLVLGLVAGAAWLHQGGGGQRAVVLADGVGQPTVVHVPDVLPLYHHGPQLGNFFILFSCDVWRGKFPFVFKNN